MKALSSRVKERLNGGPRRSCGLTQGRGFNIERRAFIVIHETRSNSNPSPRRGRVFPTASQDNYQAGVAGDGGIPALVL